MEPIEIPQHIADAEGVPEDLDSSIVGPYRFPNPRRRRLAAYLYLAGAALSGWAGAAIAPGYWAVSAGFVLLALYHWMSAWELVIHQEQALDRAARAIDFPVGHVSAAVGFEGWRSKPVWNVIVYGADEPPAQRALVRLDGQTGELIDDPYVEPL